MLSNVSAGTHCSLTIFIYKGTLQRECALSRPRPCAKCRRLRVKINFNVSVVEARSHLQRYVERYEFRNINTTVASYKWLSIAMMIVSIEKKKKKKNDRASTTNVSEFILVVESSLVNDGER